MTRLEKRSDIPVAGKIPINPWNVMLLKVSILAMNFYLNFHWLFAALRAVPSTAIVDRPRMLAKVNETMDLLCKAPPEESRLDLCLWVRKVTGQRDTIVIADKGNFQNGGEASVEGITLVRDGFESGKCGVNIHKLKADNFRRWSCTLVHIFTGAAFRDFIDLTQKEVRWKPF